MFGGAAGTATVGVVMIAGVPFLLSAAGFTLGGIAAGSLAAYLQSLIGSVGAGSLFAWLQSIGAVGGFSRMANVFMSTLGGIFGGFVADRVQNYCSELCQD